MALDRGMGGPLLAASAYFMKSPPEQYPDNIAREKLEAFIKGSKPERPTG
jgi:myo-inositol-1-phosphate synthase